jgi:hypothetical protein
MVLPQKYLDIEVLKSDNQKVLKAATEAIIGCNITAKRNMLQDAFGNSTKMKIPKCMLDQFALIKSHSGIVVKSEPNLKRMRNQVMMAKSLGVSEEAERQLGNVKGQSTNGIGEFVKDGSCSSPGWTPLRTVV